MKGDAQQEGRWTAEQDQLLSERRYRRMLTIGVLSVSAVAIVPLLVMSFTTYRQYEQAFQAELTRPMLRFVTAGKQSLEAFLSERQSALALVAQQHSLLELQAPGTLDTLLTSMNQSFGGIVDLALVDQTGVTVSYAGPHELQGVSYAAQPWFDEVQARGVYVSDVFSGYRDLPQLIVAVQRDLRPGRPFVLRATLDTDVFHFLVRSRTSRRPDQRPICQGCHELGIQPFNDVFLINEEGLLQTPSESYGDVLDKTPLPLLAESAAAELVELDDGDGTPLIVSYARIERSPFTLVALSPRVALHAGWRSLRRDLLLFPLASSLLIFAVVFWGASYAVKRARETDLERAALFHNMEYDNKMAAIGRLSAGVAHEINNPLAIITEKAGLLKDMLTLSDQPPSKGKLVELVDSVLKSADRCGGITHGLLGFAKHMDVGHEDIDLDLLLKEVLSFLEKEASFRRVLIEFDHPEDPPTVRSDRGKLQQVFLNILNNALAAVEDGGRITIGVAPVGEDKVAVSVADDGVGIPEAQLEQVFDPFFTTKKGQGTGLGLSITYGIVQKLGGQISVQSEVGKGTRFTVTLPTE
jgi:two-component system NtrC family sensor kinase